MNKHFFLIILLGCFISCKTNKTTTYNALFDKNANYIVDQVNMQKTQPDWLKLKGRAEIKNERVNGSVNINIKHRKDSVIWVSASGFLDLEMFRAMLTKDSVYFINRINKTYLTRPISYLNRIIKSDLSFYRIQDLITGSVKIAPNNYKVQLNNEGFYLSSEKVRYNITNNYRVKKVKELNNTTNIEITLGNYEEKTTLPNNISLKFSGEETAEITINYSKVEFTKTQSFFFKIPDSYDEIR